MQLKQVTYARVINTGNYENERIELTAAINEDESVVDVLDNLRQLVNENTLEYNTPVEHVQPHIPLYNSTGALIAMYDNDEEWISTFDVGIIKASDLRMFWANNKEVFSQLKEKYKGSSVEEILYETESKVSLALSPMGRKRYA